MAVQKAVADRWKQVTGKLLLEAYGLTETSPGVCINPLEPDRVQRHDRAADAVHRDRRSATTTGSALGHRRGRRDLHPRPAGDEGLLAAARGDREGDDARRLLRAPATSRMIDEKGFVRIVDRKKDMILVSGFNVYPNEVEDVVALHAGVLECAVIGVPDDKSGEAVKLFVVQEGPGADRRGHPQALRGEPHRLQASAVRRVPRRAAEDERRQDPAPRAARRGGGAEEGGLTRAAGARPRPCDARRGCGGSTCARPAAA